MKINKQKITITFNLNTKNGEDLDLRVIPELKNQLHDVLTQYLFMAYHEKYDTDVNPTNIRIKHETN